VFIYVCTCNNACTVCYVVLFCICDADPVGDYIAINQELALFSEDLAKKPQVRTTKNVLSSYNCAYYAPVSATSSYVTVSHATREFCAWSCMAFLQCACLLNVVLCACVSTRCMCMYITCCAQVVVLNKIDLPEVAAIKDELLARIKERADHTR
jgi:hypothetical protein